MRLGVATLGVILVTGAVPQRGGPCSPGHLCLFGPDGRFRRRTGRRGSGPGEFQLPHNLVVDAQGRVYVTDRDNQRVEVFDANGKFLREWPTDAGVSTLFMTKDQRIWAGGVLRDPDGRILGRLPEVGGHGTAVSDSGDVYLAQLSGKVQKFVKQ